MSPVGSEILALLAADASPDGLLVVDERGIIRFASQSLGEMFGWAPEHLVGQPTEVLIPASVRSGHRRHQAAFMNEGGARPMGVGMLLAGHRQDGTEFPLEISLRATDTGGQRLAIACVRDMTDRLTAQRELDDARERLNITVERERIARDLHDTVIQRLFGAGLTLQALASSGVDDEIRTRVAAAIDELDDTIRQIRTVVFGLHDHTGSDTMRVRIQRLVNDSGRALGFVPELIIDGPLDTACDAQVAHHALGVLRESLANVARHADASRVEVRVDTDGHDLRITVEDNGVGYRPGTSVGGRGVVNLSERATSLGGHFDIGPNPDRPGTRVEWGIPLDPAARG